MKKIILVPVFVFIAVCTMAQSKVRLNVYSSYVFDDGFSVTYDANTYFHGQLQGGYQWGGGIEFVTNPFSSAELLYFHKSSTAPVDFKQGLTYPAKHENFDVGLNYIMLGGNGFKASSSGKAEGYATIMAGALISDVKAPSTGGSSSHTSFAWGGRLGVNIWTSSRVGIKLQAQILSSSRATGGDLYFSYYGPIVLDTYTTLWQFGLGGGLTFKLGK